MAKSLNEISDILKKIRFKKTLVGGVDEEDVWRIIGKLQKEYEELFALEHAKAVALIAEREDVIRRMRAQGRPRT